MKAKENVASQRKLGNHAEQNGSRPVGFQASYCTFKWVTAAPAIIVGGITAGVGYYFSLKSIFRSFYY